MSWYDRFIPHGRKAKEESAASETEVLDAEHEHAMAMNQAIETAGTREQLEAINRRNGFSLALGNAFAAKRGTA